ncbi:hypothetical protein HUG17_7966 [Dermatophagoides farinae]|uniref:Cell cycle control protein 50A n=1 Tax=Dermatophagoides farinae TaxID=6954 RepID=A0A9D4NX94_DERFA|nr:hypothetical protein HUG17_7966 [Dermatophagoides farinae]
MKRRRRPRDSYFLQQTFRTHYPRMTVGSWIPIFKLLSIIYLLMECLREFDINSSQQMDIVHCKDVIDKNPGSICRCQIPVYMEQIPKNVYIYYGMEFYYQNYLPYVSSIDSFQLSGQQLTSDDCPIINNHTLPIVPCGMAANSMFNDTFELKKRILARDQYGITKRYLYPISIIRKNISWRFPERYQNPSVPLNETLEYAFRGTMKPKNWPLPIYELDIGDPNNNGFENEAFINWMQISPFSSFRKAYGHIDHHRMNSSFISNGLQAGQYILQINYSYPVHRFNGKKFIIISNTSPMGGKNYVLSYIFLITSLFTAIITIIFYYLDKRYGQVSTQVYDYLYQNYETDDRNTGYRYSRLN